MQQALIDLGLDRGPLDTRRNVRQRTRDAVIALQKREKASNADFGVDGIVGEQTAFYRVLKGEPQTDPLTSDPSLGLNPVLQKADELAQYVLGSSSLSANLLAELHDLVRNNRRAMGLPNSTDFNGI